MKLIIKTGTWMLVTLDYSRCEQVCKPCATPLQVGVFVYSQSVLDSGGTEVSQKVLVLEVHFLMSESLGYVIKVYSSQSRRMSHGKLSHIDLGTVVRRARLTCSSTERTAPGTRGHDVRVW